MYGGMLAMSGGVRRAARLLACCALGAVVAAQAIGVPAHAGDAQPAADGATAAEADATASPPANRKGSNCERDEFETVVEVSATALHELNMRNKPLFQERLRRLKQQRGWSHDVFLKEAAPFVRDETIIVFDRTSEDLLKTISRMGQEGAALSTLDCSRLIELRARMRLLVETQKSKWTYMFEKIDAALAGDGAAKN